MSSAEFKEDILKKLVADLRNCKDVFAVWQGGSAATQKTDEYSDIDLNILTSDNFDSVFKTVESTLQSASKITHTWQVPRPLWPEIGQKIYFLKDSPKHFFIDAVLIRKSDTHLISELIQVERHGTPIIYFDDTGLLVPRHVDQNELRKKHKRRFEEIVASYPVYKTLVLKELDRGNLIDAFNYYQNGLLRPLVELLGMIYRPFQYDFGFRYLKRSLPKDVYEQVEELFVFADIATLKRNSNRLEDLYQKTVQHLQSQVAKSN